MATKMQVLVIDLHSHQEEHLRLRTLKKEAESVKIFMQDE